MFNYLAPMALDVLRIVSKQHIKILLTITAAIWLIIFAWPDQRRLKIVFCDVGQGDAILIQNGFQQLLVDSGPGKRALDCLEKHLPFFDRTIEMAVITHAERDHFGGLKYILERYRVISFVFNGLAPPAGEDGRGAELWQEVSEGIKERNIPVRIVGAGDKIKFAGAELSLLWPPPAREPALKGRPAAGRGQVLGVQSARELNRDSLVFFLNYGSFDAWLTGDIGSKEEAELLKSIGPSRSAVEALKVPHHGSRTSSSRQFLEALHPAVSIITVGKNSYGHPTAEVLDRLSQISSKILRTDQMGDIVITTDGSSWWTSAGKNF